MTQVQEGAWVEKAAVEVQVAPLDDRSRIDQWINLYRLPWLRPLIESRWPQLLVRILAVSGFVFTILVGLTGSLVGSHNFAIIFVWIAWWSVLKLGFIPLGGRAWCSICPIPMPGEWLQQGGLLKTTRKSLGLNLRWPKRLRGSWLQSGGFLLIGLFSAVTLTEPHITSWVLLGVFLLALGISMLFENRAFCTYLCPVGGFSAMYAQASPLEVRVLDKEVCAVHEVKTCYQACPWGLYPLGFKDNSACGLCMECLRACPNDNLAVNLRPFGADLGKQKHSSRLDMAFLALVMLGSVLVFSAVFTGPWGWLKSAAYEVGSRSWVEYASGYLGLNLVLLPGLFSLAVWIGKLFDRTASSLRQAMANQAQTLFPLGLMAWIAFTVSFAFPKLNLILAVVNDPFGWGWNWLGALNITQLNVDAGISAYIQVGLLIGGLFWSARVIQKQKAGNEANKFSSMPVMAFNLAFTCTMLWLLVG